MFYRAGKIFNEYELIYQELWMSSITVYENYTVKVFRNLKFVHLTAYGQSVILKSYLDLLAFESVCKPFAKRFC